jgi:prolipoprotein diacylglyceryltransferase
LIEVLREIEKHLTGYFSSIQKPSHLTITVLSVAFIIAGVGGFLEKTPDARKD